VKSLGRADHHNIFAPSFWLGELDLRPLGLTRIVFGAVLFMCVADIGPYLVAFLSDDGVAPRYALLNGLARLDRFCLFFAVGSHWLLTLLYAADLVALAAFCVGYRTRTASVVAFILTSGMHERNVMLFDGSDNVVRVMLFWLLFMPCGARYSVDAALREARGQPVRMTAPALPMRLGQLQIAWIYLDTAMQKWPGTSWHNGAALHTALGLDHLFGRPLGQFVFHVPWLTTIGTHFAFAAEIAFLPLIFLPMSKTRRISAWLERQSPAVAAMVGLLFQPTYKALALLYGTALHVGILLLMSIGNFSYVMIGSYLLFFEPAWTVGLVAEIGRVWRRLAGRAKLVVVYDGACGFCVRTARILRGLDAFELLELRDFRAEGALAGLPERLSQADLERRMHVVASGPVSAVSAGYRGFVSVALRVPVLAPLGAIGSFPGAHFIGDPIYDAIAKKRHALHPSCDETCARSAALSTGEASSLDAWIPRGLKLAVRGVVYAGLVYLAGAAAWFSCPSYLRVFGRPVDPDTHMPQWMNASVQGAELWQKWDMFSPNPADTDIYLMGRGELADGTPIDVLRGDSHHGPMPPIMPGFLFDRWLKYVHNIAYADNAWLLEFGRFLCRHWNTDPPKGRALLKTFKIFREQRHVAPAGKPPEKWTEQMIWDHKCF